MKLLKYSSLSFLSIIFLLPPPASAHAFGQTFTLPIPLWLYLYGGGAAIIVSFILIGLFINQNSTKFIDKKIDISKNPLIIFFKSEFFNLSLKIFSLTLFFTLLLSGFFGSQVPTENLLTTFFWIIFLLGFSFLSFMIGDFYPSVNPLKILVDIIFPNKKPLKRYPQKLTFFPAVAFFILIIWLELLSNGLGVNPTALSLFLIFYLIITIFGSLLFGKKDWFEYTEVFSVYFRLLSNLSVIENDVKKTFLRPPFVGITNNLIFNQSLTFLMIFLLASTAFDSFHSSSVWIKFYFLTLRNHLPLFGSFYLTQLLLFIIFPVLFLSLYLITILIIKKITSTHISFSQLTTRFALSLMPITLAYNIAHYHTLLFINGQLIIPQLSDPFNRGWNLLATANYKVNIGLLNTSFIWHSQVVVIIIGHISAVLIAHLEATRIFGNSKKAMISQLPMLFLMVLYTIFGLWLLSLPLGLKG